MSAFDDGRVGLWINNPSNYVPRASKIANFANGMFTDVFMPSWSEPIQMSIVRQTYRPDGSYMKAQIYAVPGPTEPPEAFADRVHADIGRLRPGVAELDLERPDNVLADYIRRVIVRFRQLRPTFLIRINIAPNKAVFLPADLVKSDPNLYVCEQTFYGDMSRVSESEVLSDMEKHGVPADKDQVTYGAAVTTRVPNGDGTFTWTRVLGLPDVFYEGRIVSKLKSGLVFDDDLLADVGLL